MGDSHFKIGDLVRFKGLKTTVIVSAKGPSTIILRSVTGKLKRGPSNTLRPTFYIDGDAQRLMFLRDGTIYCHPNLGKVLVRVDGKPKKERKKKTKRSVR